MYQPPGGPPPPQGPWPGQPYPWPPAGVPYGQPPKKRSPVVAIIVTIAVVGVVGFVALVGYAFSLVDDPATDAERAKNAEDAQFVSSFSTVCERGSVSNAGAYEKPYTIVAFHQKEMDDDYYADVNFDYDSAYNSVDYSVASTNVVACLSQKEGTEKRAGTCEFDTDFGKDEIAHYSVQYDIELREARTGKSIKDLGTVEGPAGKCPTLVYQPGPRIYAGPDPKALEATLDAFVEG